MTRAIDYLGRATGDLLRVPPFTEWQAVRAVHHDPLPEIRYKFEGRGVEVVSDGLDRIQTVFIHRGGDGECLIDLLFSMGRDQVWERFGIPEKSGRPSRSPILGDSGAWDRFTLPAGTLHVQYAVGRDEIDVVTLMRADVVP